MTPLEHNKYVGLTHLAYGLIHILMIGVSMLIVGVMFSQVRPDMPEGEFPAGFLVGFMVVAGVINLALSAPSFVASYAFLKRRPWARVMGIVAAVVAAMHFPFGTAACVYTFWFLFSEPGKTLYGTAGKTLPPPPPSDWATVEQPVMEQQFEPARTPPDWRA